MNLNLNQTEINVNLKKIEFIIILIANLKNVFRGLNYQHERLVSSWRQTTQGPTKEGCWTCFQRKLAFSAWFSQVCIFGIVDGRVLGLGKDWEHPRSIRGTEKRPFGDCGNLNWRITIWAPDSFLPNVALAGWTTWKLRNWRRRKQGV